MSAVFRFLTKFIAKPNDKPWERIGGYSYGHQDMGRVPKWVKDRLPRMSMHDAVTEGSYFVLEGRRFSYRLVPSGQGGTHLDIYRRPQPRRRRRTTR